MKELDAIASGRAVLACPWGGTPGALLVADVQAGEATTQYSFKRGVTDDDLRGFA